MRFYSLFLLVLLWAGFQNSSAQALKTEKKEAWVVKRETPKEWEQLVYGARFMDRFLPMPSGTLSDKSWGDACVQPRYIDNGIEDDTRSYWGGNILKGEDGKYHLFVCGWPEDSPKGHMTWPNSTVYRAVGDKPYGPYVIADTIGRGHNPEAFRLKDGRYVLYAIGKCYIADDLNGKWVRKKLNFDLRGRKKVNLSNCTFSRREDGSFLMVSRTGRIWISRTGYPDFQFVDDGCIYPNVAGSGDFEDPVVWRDHIQYHLIVNDWRGRIAYYLRSKDGVNWVTDPGEAYTPGIAVHANGKKENWYKYERIKILQDNYGRAVQANFAVVGVAKDKDMGNDNHSSKNLCIPLNPGMLLTYLDTDPVTSNTKTIRVRISAEEDFDPQTEVDIKSLRFGASTEVNWGRGCKAISSQKEGKDLIVTFNAAGNGITSEEFAPKMIGKTKSGNLIYGYARLPSVNYNSPILSARKPIFTSSASGTDITVEVDNFGLAVSELATLSINVSAKGEKEQEIATAKLLPLKPYENANIKMSTSKVIEKGKNYVLEVKVRIGEQEHSIFRTKSELIK